MEKRVQEDGRHMWYMPHQLSSYSLLPHTQSLAINLMTGHMFAIDWHSRLCVGDCQVGKHEMPILLTLLDAWPSFLELEKLLPLAFPGNAPETVLLWLDQARQEGGARLQRTLKPLESLIERCQEHLEQVGISVVRVYPPEYLDGYRLLPLQVAQEGVNRGKKG